MHKNRLELSSEMEKSRRFYWWRLIKDQMIILGVLCQVNVIFRAIDKKSITFSYE